MSKQLPTWFAHLGWIQALVAGIFLGIGFIVPMLWWLSLVAIAWCLYCIKTSTSYTQVITLLFITWWIKSLCSLSWYVSIYPIEWIDIPNPAYQIILLLFYWGTSSAWLALGAIALAVVGRYLFLQKYIPQYLWFGFMPFVWLMSELLNGVTFALFSFGPGSILDTYFVSQGMVGYLLGTSSYGVWLAAVAGVYGLSIILVGAACVIVGLVEAKSVHGLLFCIVLVTLVQVWFSNHQLVYVPIGKTVISIDTQFDAVLLNEEEGERLKVATVRTAVDKAIERNAPFVLLPEDSRRWPRR